MHARPSLKPDELTIRPAQPGDFESVTALFTKGEQGSAPTRQTSVPKSIRQRYEGEDPNYFCLVAILANRIVGQACLKRSGSKGLLTIFVDEAQRGLGIGTALLSALIAAAHQTLLLESIEVDVFKDNGPALSLYRGLGFQIEERVRTDGAILTLSKSINEM
jgi:putative acetyltransferase